MINLQNVYEIKNVLNDKFIDKISDELGNILYESFKNKTISGIPPLTLSKCKGEPLLDYKLYGDCIQSAPPTGEEGIEVESVGVKTKNLWSYGDLNTYIHEGYEFDFDLTGTFTLSYDIDYDSYKLENAPVFEVYYDDDYDDYPVFDLDERHSITITGHLTKIKFRNIGKINGRIINIQLERNSTMTEYEPYGYKIPITARSKNLFDINNPNVYLKNQAIVEEIENGFKYTCTTNLSYSSYASYQLEFSHIAGKYITASADFTLSEGNAGIMRIGYWRAINATSSTFEAIKMVSFNKNGKVSVTAKIPLALSSDVKSGICVFINVASNANMNGATLEMRNLQVETGSNVTEYEPYVGSVTKNIYLSEPLRRIGANVGYYYKDYIDFKKQQVVRYVHETKLIDIMTTANGTQYTNGICSMRCLIEKNPPCWWVEPLSNWFKCEINSGTKKNVISFWEDLEYMDCYISASDIGLDPVTSTTTNRTIGDSMRYYVADRDAYIIYATPTSTIESIEVPVIPTFKGTTIFEINVMTKPSNVEVIYKGKS